MGKYDNIKILKETKARSYHTCYNCGKEISGGEKYYREHIEDKFLHSLHAKKYCSFCYETYGERMLSLPKKRHLRHR